MHRENSRGTVAGGRRVASQPKQNKPQKSAGKKVLWGVYHIIAVLSLLIVVGYVGFSLMVKPPEQAQGPTQPPQTGQTTPGAEMILVKRLS